MYKFAVGNKVIFRSESGEFVVRACDERFAICTQPYERLNTVYYTIIDLEKDIRGTENYVLCFGLEDDEDCNDALLRLQSGESAVSHRNYVDLDIVKVY